MFARCPVCHAPAVLDLRASMFNRTSDVYTCPKCSSAWTVEKRTGQLTLAKASTQPVPHMKSA